MSPRTPRPDLRAQKEREILTAAAAVFAERGFRGTRIADVAARAGIGKGTIYEYFRSKEELFMSLFHWYTEQAFATMLDTANDSGDSPLTVLRRSCDSLLASCQEMQELYPLTMEFWSASTASEFRERLSEEFRHLYEQFRGAIAEILRAGMARGEVGPHVVPEAVAAVLVGALDGILLQAWFDPDFDPLASGSHFLDVLTLGLATGSTSPADPTVTQESEDLS
jgi:AcrR family transcriptional regulator